MKYFDIMEYTAKEFPRLSREDMKDILIQTVVSFWKDYEINDNIKQYQKILKEAMTEYLETKRYKEINERG